jgi:hypothetical protein
MAQGLGGLVEGRHGVTRIRGEMEMGSAARCGERCWYNLLIGTELSTYKVMGDGARHRGVA